HPPYRTPAKMHRRARLCANTAIASPKARGRFAIRRTSSTVMCLPCATLQWDGGDGGAMANDDAASKRSAEEIADPFEQPYWNLDQYLIWLASRDPAAVLRATDRPNSGTNPPIGWRVHRESNVDHQKVEIEAVRAIKGGNIKVRLRSNRKWYYTWCGQRRRPCDELGQPAEVLSAPDNPEWFADLVIEFEDEPTFAALLRRRTKDGRREKFRPRFDPHSIARLYRAPTPSNIRDRPDVENPDVGPFIAYYDAWNWLAERISLRETLPIDEAGSRAEKTIRDICMNTPEKLTMWGFRKADPDAELKSVTPQAWQGLSINPLYGQPETDLKAVGRRREYGAATKGKYGPVIWTGLCFDRRQFVAASVTARGNGPPSLAPAAQPVPQQAPPSSSRRGRRARYDWDEAKIVLLDALKQRGDFDETDQENDWNCQARAEGLIRSHFGDKDQRPSASLVRSHVAKIVKEWREDMTDNSAD